MTRSPLAGDPASNRKLTRSGRLRFSVTPRPAVELPEVQGLLAGAALVDITPPPGLPKAGYSANAHTGNGFHTRLRAAITHLRTGRSSLALVQLDLLGGSPILQHLVAEAIADETDVPLAGVWIGGCLLLLGLTSSVAADPPAKPDQSGSTGSRSPKRAG